MTEDEAKTKWCPHARTIEEQGNVAFVTNTEATCVSSRCMAWRFYDYALTNDPKIDRGYCGLAGKP